MEVKQSQDLLLPILVTGMGRSGSTLVMKLLGTDEACLMDRVYPLESRYFSLIAQTAAQWDGRTFSEYGEPSAATQNILGSNPVVLRHNVASGLMNIPRSSDMLLSMWKQFSLAAKTGNHDAKFYAEKVVEWIPSYVSPFIQCFTLFLFRDPRDLFLSTNSFNAKRGYLAFGRNEGDSDLAHATTLAYRYLHRFENYKALRQSGAAVSLVRYEDVASNPVSALSDVVNSTGLRVSELQQDETIDRHRTTASIEQSIQRWKREPIADDVLDLFEQLLGDVMVQLGYETQSNKRPERSKAAPAAAVCEVTNGEQLNTDSSVLEFRVTKSDDTLSVGFDLNEFDAASPSEVWVCVSGGFGGSCTMDFGDSGSESSQKYDVGPHVATLRFPVTDGAPANQVRLTFKHAGAAGANCDPATVRLHRLIVVRKPARAVAPISEPKSSRMGNFFSQFIRVNR